MCTWGMIYNRVQYRKKMSRFRSYIAETLVAPVETVANVDLILFVFFLHWTIRQSCKIL